MENLIVIGILLVLVGARFFTYGRKKRKALDVSAVLRPGAAGKMDAERQKVRKHPLIIKSISFSSHSPFVLWYNALCDCKFRLQNNKYWVTIQNLIRRIAALQLTFCSCGYFAI